MKRPNLLEAALSTSLAIMPTGCDDQEEILIAAQTGLIPPESNEGINWGSEGAIDGICLESAGDWDECDLSDCNPEWNNQMYAWMFTVRREMNDVCTVEFTNPVEGYEVIEQGSGQTALPFVIKFDPELADTQSTIPPDNHPFGFFELEEE